MARTVSLSLISFSLFEKAIKLFVQNNESFRTKLTLVDGEVKQYFDDYTDFNIEIAQVSSDEEKAKLTSLPTSLDQALDALEKDHDYLTAGGVFPEELLTKFIATKRAECREMNAIPTPAEFEKYYNL